MDELEKKVSEINEANNKAIHDFQVENDRKLAEKASEVRLAEVKAEFMARYEAQEKELARLKALRIETPEKEPTAQTKAYDKYLRKGMEALSPEERKVLTVADSTHVGVLCPADFVNEIVRYAAVQHPLRSLATVRQTNEYQVEIPVNDARGVATWVAESGTKTETTGLTYAKVTIIPQEMKILYKATQKALEDSAFNLEQEIAYNAGLAFGTLEGTAFYSGNGTTTGPEGITANSTVAADHRHILSHDTLAFEDFIGTQYQLESPYAANASWVFNRGLMGVVVGLKSTTTNTYLLEPNLQAGQPARILGSPVYEWSDFPAISSTTLSSTPGHDGVVLAYGDFRRGYTIVDRLGMTIQRLNELYAADGMVGFYVRARVGGGTPCPPAIQLLIN